METEKELHAKIIGDLRTSMRLDKLNKGTNLVNSQKEYEKPYHVEVMLDVNLNLIKAETSISISHNIPIERTWGTIESDVKGFLNNLRAFCDIPIYEPISYNRKRTVSSWTIGNTFKEKKVSVAETEITVYPEAAKYLEKKFGIRDLKAEITKLLGTQRYANKDETKDFNRWFFLLEKTQDLKSMHDTKDRDKYSYGEKEADKTIKAVNLTAKQYNSELKKIENEMTKLTETYPFLDVPRLEYAAVAAKPKFKEWKEENETELQNEWDNPSEKETKEFKNFSEFCKDSFKRWLEENKEAFE